MLLTLLPLVPLALLAVAWALFWREAEPLIRWRRLLFIVALFTNAVSGVVLLAFILHSYIVSRGSTPADLDLAYPVLTMLVLGLIVSILALFGRRMARLVLFGNGLLTAALWYLAGMGASP